MNCPNCGTVLPNGAQSCPACGTFIPGVQDYNAFSTQSPYSQGFDPTAFSGAGTPPAQGYPQGGYAPGAYPQAGGYSQNGYPQDYGQNGYPQGFDPMAYGYAQNGYDGYPQGYQPVYGRYNSPMGDRGAFLGALSNLPRVLAGLFRDPGETLQGMMERNDLYTGSVVAGLSLLLTFLCAMGASGNVSASHISPCAYSGPASSGSVSASNIAVGGIANEHRKSAANISAGQKNFFHRLRVAVASMITVSSTENSSYLKWFCSSTLIRSSLVMVTVPVLGDSSPEIMRNSVLLPAPLAPIIP